MDQLKEPFLEFQCNRSEAEDSVTPTFRRNLCLALFTGFTITLFFVPVCAPKAYAKVFNKETLFEPNSNFIIQNMTGGNVPAWEAADPDTRYPQNPDIVKGIDLPSLWESPDLVAYWPNIFQFMFFSVYLDFPNTVQLVYQGVLGTMIANINFFIMMQFFAHGGKCEQEGERLFGLKPPCLKYEDDAYGKWGYILASLDINFVLILAFFLNIGLPVKKWCLSYSLLFMMSYMSTAGVTESHAIVITTLLGALLAIVTLLSRRLLPQVEGKNVEWGPVVISGQVKDIMAYCINFFNHHGGKLKEHPLCRDAYAMKVEELVQDMNDTCAEMNKNLTISWWESFNIRSTGAKRKQMEAFANHFAFDDSFGKVGGFEEMCHIAQGAVTGFSKHIDEKEPEDTAWEAVKDCQDLTSQLLEKIAERSVSVDKEARKKLTTKIKELKEKVDESRDNLESNHNTTSSHGFDTLKYAVIYYAKTVHGYPEPWPEGEFDWETDDLYSAMSSFLSVFWIKWNLDAAKPSAFKWSREAFEFDDEEFWKSFKWNAVNAFVIGAAFWMGYWFKGGVFVGYSPYLASSLAVLIADQCGGSSFNKNLQRLLGVVVGKSLALLAVTLVALFGCEGALASLVHLGVIYIFMTFFAYVYYEGGHWSYVSCLVVGFGCYTLGGTNLCRMWSNDVFSTNYKEIGQLTFAIVFRMAIDCLSFTSPRDLVVREMRQICWQFPANDQEEKQGVKGYILEAVDALRARQICWQFPANDQEEKQGYIFEAVDLLRASKDNDPEHMNKYADRVEKMKKVYTQVEGFLEETKPDKVLSRGPRVAFSDTLLSNVLPLLKKVISELDIVLFVWKQMQENNNTATKQQQETATKQQQETWSSIVGGVESQYGETLSFQMRLTMQMLQKALEKRGAARINCTCNQEIPVKPHSSGHAAGTGTPVVERSMEKISVLCERIQKAVHRCGGISLAPLTAQEEEKKAEEEEKKAEEGSATAQVENKIDGTKAEEEDKTRKETTER